MIINEKKLSFYSTIFTILIHLILVSFFFINLNNFKNKKPVIQATIIQAAPKKIEQKKIEQKKIEKKQNKPPEKKTTKFPDPKVNSNKDFTKNNWKGKNVLLFGSEGYGIKTKTLENSDFRFKVNMNNKIESLNIANTVSVVCHHIFHSINTESK